MPPELAQANGGAVKRAAAFLREGRLVAFPTETVYGLGADATNDRAVASIFEAKGRPTFNPLIVHVASLAEAETHAHFTPEARALARAFWPGGLTLVLKRRAETPISLLVSAGLDTIALRVPAHPLAQALIAATGRPIAAPSANASGEVSPTRAAHVTASLGHAAALALVLDGGACAVGLESTVIGFPDKGAPTLLRPGAIPRAAIEAVLGAKLAEADVASGEAGRSSPGQLASHYAPNAALRLDAVEAQPGEVLLGFGPQAHGAAMNLSPSSDLTEAAANLFAMLRALDAEAAGRGIAVSPIPQTGIGEAINDRLRRAAAPRPISF
ncbi:MAG: L-threonylcarbamoyladenylate synthase [Parvibaculum sp.]|jgi:L-threonylcarbamoyladenylate synthase|uniref:L-threonylcarbamoyladenylate synthase n=1 Tax=Parvibaculum sp. TaxID=2024848 RepID=UPI00284844AA|nr:L-threonylcarbamoyladenylate synthase [Parvibaculum sp.]MDR3497881.1 L-threonylcarbamoyladenylate synthase [Parvibaculum sp.]